MPRQAGRRNNPQARASPRRRAGSSASAFDIVMPDNGKPVTAVAILDYSMDAALRGAITIPEAKKDADPGKGRGEQLLLK